MNFKNKSDFKIFDYDLTEHPLAARYDGFCNATLREGTELQKSLIECADFVPAVIGDEFNPVFTYDRNSVKIGAQDLENYVNARDTELLYDVRFCYDGSDLELLYRHPRELQLFVDEGQGWKMVYECYKLGNNEKKDVALKLSFGEMGSVETKSYKMRRFRLRCTGWFGGIIRDRRCSVIKLVDKKAPLAVFEGSSITESCNEVCGFNGYSYARILADTYGFEYLCLAQGGTGIVKPLNERPCMYDRIDRVFKAEPDILFMEVGINDGGSDMNEVREKTANYFKMMREKLPRTFIVMIGMHTPNNTEDFYSSQRREVDTVTSAVCKEYGVPFIEIANGSVFGVSGEKILDMGFPLITGNGFGNNPNGSGNADRYTGRFGSNDNCHCNPRAYKAFARYISSAFNAIVNDME